MSLLRIRPQPLAFRGFVTLVAALMATNQLALDAMLPALPNITRGLGVSNPNGAQWVVTAYVVGLGSAQLLYGALADRFGRRPVLLVGMAIYTTFGIVAAFSTSFEIMLVARFLQGFGAAASRVISLALVRDRFAGREMARVMSLVMTVLMVAPIVAPSIGQLILIVAPWRWLFIGLFLIGIGLFMCVWLRLPESLAPENRLPLSAKRIFGAFAEVLTTRLSIGYILAMTLVSGAGMGFLTSSQQVFTRVLGVGSLFPIFFGAGAIAMALASFLNSRIVERLGSRRVAHTALLALIFAAAVFCSLTLMGYSGVWLFVPFQLVSIFCLGLLGSNFGTIAMGPMGHIAGTAASIQGLISTVGSAILGIIIGQAFNGTALPVGLGFLVLGLAALVVVCVTENGTVIRSWREA